jgi:hypothetical protein
MAAPWAGGAECRIVGEIHGSRTVNVVHFATNTLGSDAGAVNDLLLELAQAMLDCAIETLLPAVTSDWKLLFTDARAIYPNPTDPIVATAPADSVGELSATSVSFASSLVHIRTGGGGRRGRGRMFLPPPGEAQITASDMDPGTLLLITAFLTCIAGKFLGADPETNWRLGVLSRANLGGVLGNFDNAFREATNLNPVATLAVMGTRKKGRGM